MRGVNSAIRSLTFLIHMIEIEIEIEINFFLNSKSHPLSVIAYEPNAIL